jgi:ABC-type Zn uptake system ZnuABC Zn-binding protein ZnuA
MEGELGGLQSWHGPGWVLALTFDRADVTVPRMHLRPVALALLLGILATSSLFPPRPADAEPLNVVVTIPVLKDLAVQVGGPHVHVVSLLSGYENEHTYSPKPSDMVAVGQARVLLEVGLGLEVWVGTLVKSASNKRLMVVTTSKGIALVREHESRDEPNRTAQSSRQLGNPHVWLDPENAKIMLRHITEAFSAADPEHAGEYRKRQADYLVELDRLQSELLERVRHLPDRRIIVHHPAWPYFARRFGFKIVGEILTQSGSEPSAHHLQQLISKIRKEGIRVIVSEPQLNQKVPELLARETGARVTVLTPLPGALKGTETYLDMLRYNVHQLARSLEAS